MDQSKQALRDIGDNANLTCASSLKEITLIETVTSFLEENGAAEIDRKVLRTLAEALSKSVDDSTSPGVLQDVTMDNSYASFDAGRLQGDSHSPLAMPGRSMRNVEEQMSSLRKENFNLKLRLYFMEESQLGHQRTNHSGESLSKQLIDAKIEAEVLRKTVEEKTELLKDAARAISLHEEMQRKAETESQALIDELQQHLRHYEETENAVEGDTRAVLEEKLKQLDAEVLRLRQELVEAGLRQIACQEQLKSAQAEHQETLSSCEAKIEELAIKNAELVEQIEKDTQCSGQTNAKQEMDAQLADNMCELQDAQEKLKERERIHEQACRTIQKLMQKLSSQDKEIKRLNQLQQQPDQNSVKKEEENSQASISPLASSGRSLSDNEACSLEISAALKEQYEHTMAEQELKIKQLQAEVKKKTANLQNLVNKELWEKNREVERLTKLVAANQQQQQQSLPQINEDANGSMDLQQSFTEVEYTKALERNKLLQRKVDVLIHRLGEGQQNSAVIGQLRQELRQVQADAESANKWRLECADVCGVLTNRLEELAGFLNSLLKHKDVLGALAADRRHAMRRAVDRSLDLSKSLNMTLNITGTSLADQSLAQLCNLSEMLYTDADADADADAEADASHKTYNSHEEIRAAASAGAGAAISPTLEHLKAENKALKRELEKRRSTDGQQQRKERRSLPLPMQQLDNQSESEAWSEPDRKVSLARIGLEETSHSLATAEHRASESESEGRRACSARQERSRHSERIAQLEEQIAQRDERVLNVQCQMVDLDNRYKQEQLRCMEISQQMEQLRAVNEALKADLQAIGTQEDQQMDELQRLVELKTKQIDQLELAKSTLTADAQVTDMELQAAQQQLLQMEQEHAVAVDQAQAELAQLKLEAAQKLEEVQRLHQEALERDWVALSIYQEQTRELLELQRSLEYHQENEIELKQTLVENELATRALKKQLDESTLQASKAVMERTKAYNEKLQLEKRTEELRLQLELLKNGQQQRQPPARSNSSDVSQSGYTSEEVAVPMGPPNGIHSTVPANMAVVVGRMNSSSPDLGIESDAGRISSVDLCPATQRAIHTTVELHNDTLSGVKDEPVSPDTGNALNVSQQQQQPSAAATIAHDCAKVDQENAELRRKLIRTKRAFEDTYEKLRLANKAKAQVEKDIKNQILKTHNVLRNVRSNMENEL